MSVQEADLQLGPKLHTMRFPIRWGEMDALGHVNHAAYLKYFEESRVAWDESVGAHFDGAGEGKILLKATVTYRKQLAYPANVEVALFAGKVGNSSFHLTNTLTVEGDTKPATIGEFVMVWFDYRAGKSVPIPPALRAVLEGKGAPA